MMSGELRGARTTATESKGAFSQAIKPALSKARYITNTFIPWDMQWDATMWEYFGDRDRMEWITHGKYTDEIAPENVPALMDVRVTAIDNFESDVMKLAEEDQFLQVIWPIYAPLGGKAGQITWLKKILRRRNYDVEGLFPGGQTVDAERVADSENTAILEGGIEDYPMQGENHEAHLNKHRPALRIHEMLPLEQQNQINLQIMRIHIAMTEQLLAVEQAQTTANVWNLDQQGGRPEQQEPAVSSASAQPGIEGEALADQSAGMLGAYRA
jgi:hypothetical protein